MSLTDKLKVAVLFILVVVSPPIGFMILFLLWLFKPKEKVQ